MIKKITLLFLICSIVFSGYAQKSKRKAIANAPKSSYFEILINENATIEKNYCPNQLIRFDLKLLDSTITNYSFCWSDIYHSQICDTTPIFWEYPLYPDEINKYFTISVYLEIQTDSVPYLDTLYKTIYIDYFREEIEVEVCMGRNITITTNTHGDTTFYDIKGKEVTLYDTIPGSSCDSLVRWVIVAKDYETFNYSITSCDSIIWGEDFVLKRPIGYVGDYSDSIFRKYPSGYLDPCCYCDTLRKLHYIIIGDPILNITFDQGKFCEGDDMKGIMSVEGTNYTAFNWLYQDDGIDSTFTEIRKYSFEISEPGDYYVTAYMDTSLYDTLKDLRIVWDCFTSAQEHVDDCPLIIPNIITPDGDALNQWLGIKKLNLRRKNEINIYDRWGKNVFQQKDYKCLFKERKYFNTEKAFEGISRGGQELPEGVYYYAFYYDSKPKRKTYTGIITILRKK